MRIEPSKLSELYENANVGLAVKTAADFGAKLYFCEFLNTCSCELHAAYSLISKHSLCMNNLHIKLFKQFNNFNANKYL